MRASHRHLSDHVLVLGTRAAAVAVLLMMAVLLAVLFHAAWPSIQKFGVGFVTSSEWRPNELEHPKHDPQGNVVMEDGEVVMETTPPAFGALPVLWGTAASAFLALLFAVPVSLLCALFLVRVAPRLHIGPVRIAGTLSFLVELIASIPSIAIGMWGLFVVAPVVGRNLLCGSLVLAVMILPIITAVARDVLRAVPTAQIEGVMALGATWWQTCWAMLRVARPGLFGAVVLGFARAAGETMAVTMVIGNAARMSLSPLQPAQTMSSLLANEFAEATSDMHRAALLEVALLLLVSSLLLNMVARTLVVGRRVAA